MNENTLKKSDKKIGNNKEFDKEKKRFEILMKEINKIGSIEEYEEKFKQIELELSQVKNNQIDEKIEKIKIKLGALNKEISDFHIIKNKINNISEDEMDKNEIEKITEIIYRYEQLLNRIKKMDLEKSKMDILDREKKSSSEYLELQRTSFNLIPKRYFEIIHDKKNIMGEKLNHYRDMSPESIEILEKLIKTKEYLDKLNNTIQNEYEYCLDDFNRNVEFVSYGAQSYPANGVSMTVKREKKYKDLENFGNKVIKEVLKEVKEIEEVLFQKVENKEILREIFDKFRNKISIMNSIINYDNNIKNMEQEKKEKYGVFYGVIKLFESKND